MSVLGEIVGGSFPFTHAGKTYRVRIIDQDALVEFERRQYDRARQAAGLLRGLMDSAEYVAHLKALNEDYLDGEYALEGERGRKALRSPAGMLCLLSVLFSEPEGTILKLLLSAKEDVLGLLNLILKESFPEAEPEPDRAAEMPAAAEGPAKNAPGPARVTRPAA